MTKIANICSNLKVTTLQHSHFACSRPSIKASLRPKPYITDFFPLTLVIMYNSGYGAPPARHPTYHAPPPSHTPNHLNRHQSGYGGGYQQHQPHHGPPAGADPQLWQWFSNVDTDRSGSITAVELQNALVNGDWSSKAGIPATLY
jgi:hypothetical protein